ncbi:MAG: hypothetical protein LBD23_15160, partial [Oscillospiraceae bacterium]|nr:hypothetical protein [Oscillospiraceae bacterium]
MDLYLQMGHGMRGICKELSSLWGGTSVILSPMNIDEERLLSFSNELNKTNCKVLLDPQMYDPMRSHKKLIKYSYWPEPKKNRVVKDDYSRILLPLYRLNEQVQSNEFILPSQTTNRIDEQW